MPGKQAPRIFVVLALAAWSGCKGRVTAPPGADAIAMSGLRRLTSNEYDNTLQDLLADSSRSSVLRLPATQYDPFDNDFTYQYASQALIEGAEGLATDASARLLADPARRDQVVGCTPTGPNDLDCLAAFIRQFGRRALRRSLTPVEVSRYLTFAAESVSANDFYVGVDMVIRAMLQQPRFLYRVELGQPVADDPEALHLDGPEVASRLSYFLWGSMPPDWLLDLAESGQLATGVGVRAAAQRALADPRAVLRVLRFHALWLGYDVLPFDPGLSSALRTESDALIEKVVFQDQRPWQDIFRSDTTYISDTLALHYGLTPPGSAIPVWTPYGNSGRRGILSHGTFLSNGAKFGDTSPTQRGLAIRRRLICQDMPPPPPGVNTDAPVPATATAVCKVDRYQAHSQGGCAACHQYMDPIGFGLENYDQSGAYRTHDADNASCIISGQGNLVGIGGFAGPGQLAGLLLQSGDLDRCAVTQLYRFAFGHYALDEEELPNIDALQRQMGSSDYKFEDLVLALVSSRAFLNARNPGVSP